MKDYLLFDLDGTLTDPKLGITTCVQYALKDMGIEESDLDKLEPFIGPPLKDSFMEFYRMSSEQADKCVEKYRERFSKIGLFENEVYEGIVQMLKNLQAKGMHLAVASSKPTVYVKQILEHFQIDSYFEVIVGSELDGRRVNKDEVVAEALRQLFGKSPVRKERVYMIGDRRFDVEGAQAMQVESIGVTYGYGGLEELKEAKADYIVQSVAELTRLLDREADEKLKEAKPGSVMGQRIWTMLFSFLLFLIVRNVVQYALGWLLSQTGAALGSFFVVYDETGAATGFTGNAATIMSAVSYVCGAFAVLGTAKQLIGRTKEDTYLAHLRREPIRNYVMLAAVTVGITLGVNLLFELLQITTRSDVYQAVASSQYSAHFLVTLLCLGIVTPIAEEILFRGIIFTYCRRFMAVSLAMVVSALAFGAYHMNSVQGTYGFLMGCLMAYGYEKFGSFLVPVLIHIGSNVIAVCLTYSNVAETAFVSWPVCLVLLAVGVACLWLLERPAKIKGRSEA